MLFFPPWFQLTLNAEQPGGGEETNRGMEEKEERAEPFHPGRKEIEGHAPRELNIQEKQEAGDEAEEHMEQVAEEHKKELEEEEMEQAGQPEHLTEDLDQAPEEQEWKEKEQTEEETKVLVERHHSEVSVLFCSSWFSSSVCELHKYYWVEGPGTYVPPKKSDFSKTLT